MFSFQWTVENLLMPVISTLISSLFCTIFSLLFVRLTEHYKKRFFHLTYPLYFNKLNKLFEHSKKLSA